MSPLMPHTTLVPPHAQLVDFGLGMEHLNGLKGAVDQAGHAIEEPEAKQITI
jgi:hypothetical protein